MLELAGWKKGNDVEAANFAVYDDRQVTPPDENIDSNAWYSSLVAFANKKKEELQLQGPPGAIPQ